MYAGYYEHKDLPIKNGDVVVIRKGVMVKPFGGPAKPAGKTYRVKVDHVLSGSSDTEYQKVDPDNGAPTYYVKVPKPLSNPTVRWAGSSGVWCEVDINDVITG